MLLGVGEDSWRQAGVNRKRRRMGEGVPLRWVDRHGGL